MWGSSSKVEYWKFLVTSLVGLIEEVERCGFEEEVASLYR